MEIFRHRDITFYGDADVSLDTKEDGSIEISVNYEAVALKKKKAIKLAHAIIAHYAKENK